MVLIAMAFIVQPFSNTKISDVIAEERVDPIITGGYDFSTVRMEDGSLWSWGANDKGQLGLDDKENRLHPVKLDTELENKDIKKMFSGDQNTLALTNDGEVYVWGVGKGVDHIDKPRKLNLDFKVKDIGWSGLSQPGTNHNSTALLSEDGKVYMFGSYYYQQGGRGLTKYNSAEKCEKGYIVNYKNAKPVLTKANVTTCEADDRFERLESGEELNNVKLVDGSNNGQFYVAVTENNNIYTWGRNHSKVAKKNINNKITGDIEKVLASRNKFYALTSKKEVWEWKGTSGTPQKLSVDKVKDISVQNESLLVLKTNGDVYGKGKNDYGQLGKGGNKKDITKIKEVSNVKAIGSGFRHSLFFYDSGEIFGMGWNSYRQIGNEDDGVYEEFKKIDNIDNVTDISANRYTSNAVKDNSLYSWGKLSGSLYGDPSRAPKKINVKDFESKKIQKIKGSPSKYRNNTVLLTNGDAYTSGHSWRKGNGHKKGKYIIGKLEHNPKNDAYTENIVENKKYIVDNEVKINPQDIDLIDAVQGYHSGVAVDLSGQLLSWGYNNYDIWGVGNDQKEYYDNKQTIGKKSSHAFINVNSDKRFKKVDGRAFTRLALSRDGEVYSWGRNLAGSIGRSGNKKLPKRVDNLTNIKEISMGDYTGIALNKEGEIYTWGKGNLGQIGNGRASNRTTPTKIANSLNKSFQHIHSGKDSMFAVTEDGELYSWGNNRYGQLGLGDRKNRTGPRKVESLKNKKVEKVANGEEHTIVLLENGDVYSAGSDSHGQLGLDEGKNKLELSEIPFPDYVSIHTKDNQEKELGDTITIEGDVTSIAPNSNLELMYEIEMADGSKKKGKIKEFTSKKDPTKFTKKIKLNDDFELGSYTFKVIVNNKDTGLRNSNSINFGAIDKTPPTTPKINAKTTDWTNKNVSVKITEGEDEQSGVDKTEYRLNKGEWEVTNGEVTIRDEGVIKIQARTIDNAGNVSKVAEETVKIDKTKPEVIFEQNTEKWTNKDITLKINTNDEHSGVEKVKYIDDSMVESGDLEKEIKDNKLTVTENGKYSFVVEDKAGNITKESHEVTNIDKNSPTKPTIKAPEKWTSDDVEISMEHGEDNESGVNYTEYRFDNEEWVKYEDIFDMEKQGEVKIEARTVDNAGNKSGIVSKTTRIDKSGIKEIELCNEDGVYEETINYGDEIPNGLSEEYCGDDITGEENIEGEKGDTSSGDISFDYEEGFIYEEPEDNDVDQPIAKDIEGSDFKEETESIEVSVINTKNNHPKNDFNKENDKLEKKYNSVNKVYDIELERVVDQIPEKPISNESTETHFNVCNNGNQNVEEFNIKIDYNDKIKANEYDGEKDFLEKIKRGKYDNIDAEPECVVVSMDSVMKDIEMRSDEVDTEAFIEQTLPDGQKERDEDNNALKYKPTVENPNASVYVKNKKREEVTDSETGNAKLIINNYMFRDISSNCEECAVQNSFEGDLVKEASFSLYDKTNEQYIDGYKNKKINYNNLPHGEKEIIDLSNPIKKHVEKMSNKSGKYNIVEIEVKAEIPYYKNEVDFSGNPKYEDNKIKENIQYFPERPDASVMKCNNLESVVSDEIIKSCAGHYPNNPSTSIEDGMQAYHFVMYRFLPAPIPNYEVESIDDNGERNPERFNQVYKLDDPKNKKGDDESFIFTKEPDGTEKRSRYLTTSVEFDFSVKEKLDEDSEKDPNTVAEGKITYDIPDTCYQTNNIDLKNHYGCNEIMFFVPNTGDLSPDSGREIIKPDDYESDKYHNDGEVDYPIEDTKIPYVNPGLYEFELKAKESFKKYEQINNGVNQDYNWGKTKESE